MRDTPLSNQKFDQTERDAVRWFTRINHGDGDPDLVRNFHQWLNDSQTHRAAYDSVCGVMESAQEFTANPLLKEYYRSATLKNHGASSPSWNVRLGAWWGRGALCGAAIAVAASLVMIIIFQYENFYANSYQTAVGEIKTITLEDNSVIRLNTRTVLRVKYDDQKRLVILEKGQATFSVAKNPDRPFVVSAGMGQVTALGTEFDIHKTNEGLYISLIEGKVQVRHRDASKIAAKDTDGKFAVIMEADNMHAVYTTLTPQGISEIEIRDSVHVTAWQQRKIVFQDKSLSYVIKELNRYSARPIVLKDISRKDELITAVVPTNISAALVLIKKHFNLVQATENKDEIILISKRATQI